MHRLAYQQLLQWKGSKGRKPLILRGARQVGKTTLLKMFAESEYENTLYLNFEDKPALCDLFKEDLDPTRIIKVLSLFFEQPITAGKTLLILDEIQECPEALNSLKYFCEAASEQHICAAGSLLGVKLAHEKGFPVGKVQFADLYPLSFFEFLEAIHQDELKDFLLSIDSIAPLPKPLHEKLTKLFKDYLYIGGMPEAVLSYREDKNFDMVRKIQNNILDGYSADFAKHAPKNEITRITEVWNNLPSQLAKENKKFIYSKIKASARGRDYETAIQWLIDAGLTYKVSNVSTAKLPLSGYVDMGAFKLYTLDVGLLGAMADISPKLVIQEDTLFSHFNGSFIENYAAQSFKPFCKQLHYWTSAGTAELDFLLQHENRILPVEVKSGTSRKKQSLRVFREKYHPELSLVLSPANLILDGKVLNCPLYLTDQLTQSLLAAGLPH